MTHTPHEIAEEFPDDHETIHTLKMSNGHFGKLADEYHEVNRKIHRIETEIEPASDLAMEEFKKKRLALKDEISLMIQNA